MNKTTTLTPDGWQDAQPSDNRRPYVIPRCKVICIDNETLICTSVTGNASSSEEEEWDEKNGNSGGYDI